MAPKFSPLIALLAFLCTGTVHAAGLGEQCKLGSNVSPEYLCPWNTKCIKSISNYYCSNLTSVCGWGGTGGYGLGKQKTHNGKQYQCFLDGFKRIYALGQSCSYNSQCQSGYCSGSGSSKTCQNPPSPVPATAQQMIQGMASAGASLETIIVTVMETKDMALESVLAMMKAMLNTQAQMMASTLRNVEPDAPDHHLVLWMLAAGYDLAETTAAVKSVLGVGWEAMVGVLAAAGESAERIVGVVRTLANNVEAMTVAAWLRAADFGIHASHWAIMQGWNIGAVAAAKVVAAAGWSRAQVLELMTFIGAGSAQAAEVILGMTARTHSALRSALIDLRQWAASTGQYTRAELEAFVETAGGWAQDVIDAVLDEIFGAVPAPLLPDLNQWDKWSKVATDAALLRAQQWLNNAYFDPKHCTVHAVNALGTPGVLKSRVKFSGAVGAALKRAGASDTIVRGWDRAMTDAWVAWASKVTLPGLPMYPAFAAVPMASAPPMPNIPFPLELAVSPRLAEMSPRALAQRLTASLGRAAARNRQADVAIKRFGNSVGAAFATCLATCQVMQVMGKGPVPTFAPPKVPVGPVVGGTCSGGRVDASSFMSMPKTAELPARFGIRVPAPPQRR